MPQQRPPQIGEDVTALMPAVGDDVTALMAGGPPEPSVMDERGIVDKAVDWLPSVGGALGGLLGGTRRTPTGMALSGIGASGGEAARQTIRSLQGRHEDVPDTAGDQLKRIATVGGMNAAQEGFGRLAMGTLRYAAPKLMDAALGAQKIVRKKFRNVDLPAVALRERAIVGSPSSEARIGGSAAAANAAVPAAAEAIDAGVHGGPHAASAADVLPDLMKLRDKFALAKADTEVQAIDDYIAEIQGKYPMSAVETNARRQYTQTQGRGAQPSATDPRIAGAHQKANAAESRGLTRISHDDKRMPGMGPTLTRAQELMALQQSLQNAPRPRLFNQQSLGMAALRKTAGDPRVLSGTGIAADWAANALQGPGARIPDALVRQMLLQLLAQEEPQD